MKTLIFCIVFASCTVLSMSNTDPFNIKASANDIVMGDGKFIYAASHTKVSGVSASSFMEIASLRIPSSDDDHYLPLAKDLSDDLLLACQELRQIGDIGAFNEFCT